MESAHENLNSARFHLNMLQENTVYTREFCHTMFQVLLVQPRRLLSS